MPLIKIFDEYAALTARQQNSVRNYYYKELAYLSQNLNLAKDLEINLDNHQVTKATSFSTDETNDIVNNIDNLKAEGYSVRKACLMLSGNDAGKMIRLQNKYRSVKASQAPMGEIIKMPQRQVIGDEEIKALFLGLVKLIKKGEQEKAKNMVEKELYDANQKLKNAVNELIIKNFEVQRLQKNIMICQQENQNLAKTVQEKNIALANEKSKSAKLLASFWKERGKVKLEQTN